MRKFFQKHLFIFLLLFLEIVLFITNFKPGSFLYGWDNSLPELNFSLNFKRQFFAIWQEYRGLGLLDGMSHVSKLAHTFFIFLLSFVLPANILRYFFHFLMHFLGGMGIYFLMLSLFKTRFSSGLEQVKNPVFRRSAPRINAGRKTDRVLKPISFVASLFYLLNIGTIQMFYTPLEVFSVHFAALPWLSLFLIKFLKTGLKKDLILFFIISFLAIPQAFVPTVFIVYFLSVIILALFKLKNPKRVFLSLAVVFAVNAFWLLPYIYSAFKNVSIIINSKINIMSTENNILKAKSFGDFQSVALIYGYSLDSTDLQPGGNSDYMMKTWRNHLDNLWVQGVSWLFFGLAILGLVAVVKERKKEFYPFLAIFIICFLILGSSIPVFSLFFKFLAKYISLFKAVFRNPFTKFSILYVFSYSLLLGLGLQFVLNLISRFKKRLSYLLFITYCLLLIVYSWPVFKGNFFYQNLQVKIPQKYFDLIDYFKNQSKNNRLVVLPQPNFWGWTKYKWGFRGSGFIWQGLPQASMDGAFLPWSQNNENYYWEVSQAIYSQNLDLLESILEKYQINWLVLDKNITIGGDYKALYFPQTEKLFSLSNKISLVKQFGNIKVYQVNLQTPVKDFIFLASNLPQINPYNWNNEDTGFLENGHYITDERQARFSEPDVFYPFRSLFTGRKQEELEFRVEDYNDHFIFSNNIPFKPLNLKLFKPLLSESESKHWTKDLKEEPIATPSVELKDNKVEVKVDKKKGYFSYDSQDDENFFQLESHSCNPFNTGEMDRKMIKENNQQWLRFNSVGSSNCLSVNLPHLIQKKGYLVEVKARHLHGKSLLFKIINETSKNTIIETELPEKGKDTSYFIIPPMEKYGTGYSLHFDNISIGRQKTINDLARVEVYPIPYRFLKQIKIDSATSEVISSRNLGIVGIGKFQVSHPNPSFYQIQLKPSAISHQPSAIILSQSFHPGWIAFTLEKKSLNFKPLNFLNFPKINILGDHIMVNNWSNGWRLGLKDISGVGKSGITIYLFFLPQLLEYLGFLLLLLFLSYSYLQIH